jgi:hypothetical protein
MTDTITPTPRQAALQRARAIWEAHWAAEVDPDGTLPAYQREALVAQARREHYTALAHASWAKRRARP